MAAQMIGQGEELLEELLQCMICYEPYCNPKILQCGHTFCEECLQGYHNANQKECRFLSGNLPCPNCREITSIPMNGIAGLRNDFRMKKMEDVFRKMAIHNRASTSLCNPCQSLKMMVVAKVYCIKCNVNYCEKCLLKHMANPVFEGHTVVDKSTLQCLTSVWPKCKVRVKYRNILGVVAIK